jgi:uncharacterized protein YukE
MSGEETMIYNPLGMADLTSQFQSFSQELEQIRQQCEHELNASRDFFKGKEGATSFAQVLSLVNSGIDDGQQVIRAHGDVVDHSSTNFSGTDSAVGGGFLSI